jgi:type II secretory pathway component PulL
MLGAPLEPEMSRECNRHGPTRYTAVYSISVLHRDAMNRLAICLAILILAPGAAVASQQGVAVVQKWKLADKCTQQAQAAFPDFTPESVAKREAKLQECLAGQNLPPRQVGPPQ